MPSAGQASCGCRKVASGSAVVFWSRYWCQPVHESTGVAARLVRDQVERDDEGVRREDVLAVVGRDGGAAEGAVGHHLGHFEAAGSLGLKGKGAWLQFLVFYTGAWVSSRKGGGDGRYIYLDILIQGVEESSG